MQVRLSPDIAARVNTLAESERRSASQMATILCEEALAGRGDAPRREGSSGFESQSSPRPASASALDEGESPGKPVGTKTPKAEPAPSSSAGKDAAGGMVPEEISGRGLDPHETPPAALGEGEKTGDVKASAGPETHTPASVSPSPSEFRPDPKPTGKKKR